MRTAAEPFQFMAASYLTRIDNQRASSLNEMRTALSQVNDTSIFYHTFQTLGLHHFLTDGFSNDIAQWVLASLNRPELAEGLAGLDIRDYVSLAELRGDLLRLITDYCAAHPKEADVSAFEPFYFCESLEVTVPFGVEAGTLAEFREGLVKLSHASFYFHFISSRLRLHLKTNDFSHWFANSLGLETLARGTDNIDIYTNTLDSARDEILEQIDREMSR